MTEQVIKQIHYLEDSDDEVFLSRLLFETESVDLELVHHVSLTSLEEALSGIGKDDAALVAIDLNMPVMKGTEVIQHVLDIWPNNNFFMGICSGSEDPADENNARQVGARFFVHKPLDARCLRNICDLCEELEFRVGGGGASIIVANLESGSMKSD